MSYTEQINTFSEKLGGDSDLKAKHTALMELCDVLESFLGSGEYGYFLEKLVPIFVQLLESVAITFSSLSLEHKIRNSVLEIFHRAVCNDILSPYAPEILDQMHKVLRTDNEDNGVLCMKVIVNLHKAFKNNLFEKVQPFIDTINEIYANMKTILPLYFNDQTKGESNGEGDVPMESVASPQYNSTGNNNESQAKHLVASMKSFRTLAEYPIILVSLLSSYKQLVNTALPTFIPLLINFLQLEVDAQKQAREEATKRNETYTSVSPEIKDRTLYGDFILSQVKAASFLAYISIRGHSAKLLSDHNSVIPDIILRLLQDCPSELSSARKELLHATRHILSTSYKPFFLPKLDLLFNEKILLGDGFSAYETLRPLAYSTAADFLHNTRSELTSSQVWKAVMMYSRLLQDTTVIPTVQIMSAKLLLNLLERINKLPSSEARRLCFIIIEAYTNRFESLNAEYNSIMKRSREYKSEKEKSEITLKDSTENRSRDLNFIKEEEIKVLNDEELDINYIIKNETIQPDEDVDMKDSHVNENDQTPEFEDLTLFDLQYEYPIQIFQPSDTDPLKDARYLFRTLLNFLKTVILLLRQTNPPPPSPDYNVQAWNNVARMFDVEEVNILKKLFKQSVICSRFFQNPKTTDITEKQKAFDIRQPNLPISASKDEKDLMEVIAAMFSKIDLSTFNEIVVSEIEFLVNEMVNYVPLLHLAHFFLGSEVTSSNFLGIVLNYLKSKLEVLDEDEAMTSHIFLRLLKLCLLSLNLYQTNNEPIVTIHVRDLILKSLELSTKAKDPIVYFYLIRTLFKSISSGKFESINSEIFPLLPSLLKSLSKLIDAATTLQEREIYIELCLTVPVKINRMVSFLKFLMRPIALALNGSHDLITQSLRMLELCIDNVTAEYLDPVMDPVIDEIMKALWKHLRPYPYYYVHSHTAVRILGKLGGRNRKFIKPSEDLTPQETLSQRLEILVSVDSLKGDQLISVTTGVETAINMLEDPRQTLDPKIATHYRINAFKYLSSVFKLFVDGKDMPGNYWELVKEGVQFLLKDKIEDERSLENMVIRDQRKFNNQEKLAERLLNSIFFSASIKELNHEVNELIQNICRHFTQLYIVKHIIKRRKNERHFSVNDGEGKVFINEHILLNSIVYALSSHLEEVKEAGIAAVKSMFDFSVSLFGSIEKSLNFILLRSLSVVFFHACYDELYYNKYGGVLGLKVMIKDAKIPIKWFSKYQVELVRALFYVLRDTPENMPVAAVDMSVDLIKTIIRGCNEGTKNLDCLSSNLVSSLVYDLANSNKVIRQTSKDSLEILADITGLSISKIINPSKTLLLNPIFSKPLRALPLHMQVGNIEAINFWLVVSDGEDSFNEEMKRLLQEAIAILNTEDLVLVGGKRLFEYHTREKLTELRVVCVNLLKIVISKPDYPNAPRMDILSTLFKALCSPESRIIEASYLALKVALSESTKLPRNLLQSGLRPMLMNLADHKKLSVSNLEALAKLLVLLISYFKVEIGNKLMDHLKAWATPHTLHVISSQDLSSNSTIKIVSAILNIFHLLPEKARIFIPDILSILNYLEFNLRRCQGSPFRVPIGKFLNRFASETFTYYLDNFKSTQDKLPYFIQECPELKNVAKSSFSKLLESVSSESDFAIKVIKYGNLINVATAISESESEWIFEEKAVLEEMRNLTQMIVKKNNEDPFDKSYHFQLSGAVSKFQKVFAIYLRHSKDLEMLISFLKFASESQLVLSVDFEEFVFEVTAKSNDTELRQDCLNKCVTIFLEPAESLKTKVMLSKKLLHPIILFENHKNGGIKKLCEKNNELSTAEWLNSVHTKIWKSTGNIVMNHAAGEVDHYRMELLQMTACLISMAKDVIENLRKDVIKFSWCLNRLDDALTKNASYLTSCYFINAYATPLKIRTNLLVALLRDNNSDIKYLVQQSLDLIAPVMGDTDDQSEKNISWLKYPRRVISENGFMVSNIVNVYKFMVRHKDIFFYARDHFISTIITAMGKLTILQNTSTDNQTLALDIAELILYWEKKTKELKTKESTKLLMKEKKDIKSGNNDNDYATSLSYSIPFGQKEAFITFLIRYVCINTQRSSNGDLGKRALNVLYELLSPGYWSDVTVKLSFFDKFLIEPDFNNANNNNILLYCINSLEVLSVSLNHKSNEWIIDNLPALQNLLDKSIRSDNHDVQEALQKVLRSILNAIKEETDEDQEYEPEEIKNFLNLLTSVISDDLGNTSSLAAGVTLCWTVTNYKPERLNNLFPSIMKTFGKLCKDHVTIINQKSGDQQSKSGEEAKMTTKLLDRLLCFAAMRISHLGDQRRIYLSLLAQLIEKTSDPCILSRILSIVHGFIFKKDNLFPTTKEKAAILGKMMGFETRKDIPKSLAKSFYKIIIKIFEDDSFLYSDLTQRLEHPFLIGTRFFDVGIRSRLMKFLNECIEDGIDKRLNYVIKEQNWEYLADYPWLIQAVEILFGSLKYEQRAQLSEKEYKFAPLEYFRETIVLNENKITDDSKDEEFAPFIAKHKRFLKEVRSVTVGDIFIPLIEVLRSDTNDVNKTWAEIFSVGYKGVSDSQKVDFARSFSSLLAKDYHLRQVKLKPNVIQGLLGGGERCEDLHIPPHLVKYLGTTFDAYYSCMHMVEKVMESDNKTVKEAAEDAYCEILSKLQESDLFDGLWKKRARYSSTKAAISFEQIGIYDKALNFYEDAQIEARNGFVPYGDAEYMLWEDNWISCAQKLQQWDVLVELAKNETYTDLLLECGWRVANWNDDKESLEQSIRSVIDVPTTRRQFFHSYLLFQGFCQQEKSVGDLMRSYDEGIQLALSKWNSLPSRPTTAHISLLHTFQQYIELNEATKAYGSMITTNAQNSESKLLELQGVLRAWRERLPNLWDDISIWNDLCTQRLHAYNLLGVLNRPFLGSANNNNIRSSRGYHETAFMINRFANVARKHGMPEVCVTQLTKIYTLPNIEISEAFIKLTEQAKCHYQSGNEINSGLDVITNTNLSYFNASQKAEFLTLKGMFQAKLNAFDEANQSFSSAVNLDRDLPKVWAEWGFFSYRLFKQGSRKPTQNQNQLLKYAGNSLTCFLNAAGLYKSDKSRRCIALILWLISLDDQKGTLANEFNNFKGEVPVWYWITFIPQLLTSLSHREAKIVKQILLLIGKKYPQALHFPLRTTKEDLLAIQKQLTAQAGMKAAAAKKEEHKEISKQDHSTKEINNEKEEKELVSTEVKVKSETKNIDSDVEMKNGSGDEEKSEEHQKSASGENSIGSENNRKSEENPAETSKETSEERPEGSSEEKSEGQKEKSGEKADEKLEEKSNEKPEEQSEKSDKKPEIVEEQPEKKSEKESEGISQEISAEKPEEKPKEKLEEKPEEKPEGKSGERSEDKSEEKTKISEESNDVNTIKVEASGLEKEIPTDIIDGNNETSTKNSNTGNADNSDNSAGASQDQKGGKIEEKSTSSTSTNGGQPWEYVEEIMSVTKTSYPLLALSLELLVDQITQRFKSNADEDAYRLVVALLNDAMLSYSRISNPEKDIRLPQHMENNISRFAGTVLPKLIRVEFEKDLIESKPNFLEYISKLIEWRGRLENKLDRRFNKINLENICPHLTEFHHQKFEGIEVPGQYLLNEDTNNNFVKIERFLPTLEIVRGYTSCFKKLQIRGHDGSIQQFSVQFPSNRHSRREERIFQMYRILGSVLDKKVQSRSRNIKLTVPTAVPLSPHIRVIKNDEEDVTLLKIYEHHCLFKKQRFDEPFFYTAMKLREAFNLSGSAKVDIVKVKMEILNAVQSLYTPTTIVRDYFFNLYEKYEDFWIFRKQFTSQYASFIFMTYMMSITGRQPHKIHMGTKSGSVWTSDMLCNKSANVNFPGVFGQSLLNPAYQRKSPVIHSNETVPFRLTPNIQKFIGEIGVEGILSVYFLVIARCFSEPEFELDHYLNLFVRDEIIAFFSQNMRSSFQGALLREIVRVNSDLIIGNVVKAGSVNNSKVATQNVNELISHAVNPRHLAQFDSLWRSYL
ncbi:hypothetical protein DASC09_035420 [Saccharomycopsis crataegensis]|uniref:Non-specific serine/threonine protein kinase n=1 Tax=Saccharomycopsis crataegensis TaxID=43959 RepID=A0AAV5QNW4_9ASCO|nr:hypothetical protein DASC09_035420 [Saccharomycopsis crataegensis]